MIIDWTEIILSVITLLGGVLLKVLIPYLKEMTTEKQRKNIDYWVKAIVTYIEKNYTNIGHIKKEEVTKIVKEMDLKITPTQLNILIDAIVEWIINKPYEEFMLEEI